MAIGLWIGDNLRVDRLRSAVERITQRHEIFRTRFYDDEDGVPMQEILPTSPVYLEQVRCADSTAASEGFEDICGHSFDLESGNTARFVLFTGGEKENLVVIAYHHIILDGAGFDLSFNEFNLVHLGMSDLPKPFQYAEFSERQRKEMEEGKMADDMAGRDTAHPPGAMIGCTHRRTGRPVILPWSEISRARTLIG